MQTVPMTTAGFFIQFSDFLTKSFALLPFFLGKFSSLLNATRHKFDEDFCLPVFENEMRKDLREEPFKTRRVEGKLRNRLTFVDVHIFLLEQISEVINYCRLSFGLADRDSGPMIVRMAGAFPIMFSRLNSQPAFPIENPSNVAPLALRKFYGRLGWWRGFANATIVGSGRQLIAPCLIAFRRIWTSFSSVGGPMQLHRFAAAFAGSIKNIDRFVVSHGDDCNNHWIEKQVVFIQ